MQICMRVDLNAKCGECEWLYDSLRNSLTRDGLMHVVDAILAHLQETKFHLVLTK